MNINDYLNIYCMKTPICSCLFLLGMILGACSDTKKETEQEGGVSMELLDEKNDVSIMKLKRQAFSHELVSNGKIVACGKADLRFETAEIIEKIYVKNGDFVKKGQKLAELDKFKLHNQLLQAADALERAKLELQDVLIGQGYAVDAYDKVPQDVMKLAKVKSGYDQSLSQYELAERAEKNATLVAPFDGVVANLFTKPYNIANTGEVFCSVVDMHDMETDFMVLESELALVKIGDRVVVTPYSNAAEQYKGRVVEVNPIVDENGMVKVKAKVDGKGNLFSGMNVRISVRRSLGDELVIPKTAVVLRSGKQVVFTLKDGAAQWNYVQTGLENADSCIVSDRADEGVKDGLLEGDVVIVTGNVNLAHGAPVNVIEK